MSENTAIKYRTRATEVQAVRWVGDNFEEIRKFAPGCLVKVMGPHKLRITQQGQSFYAHEGDYIVLDTWGFYHALASVLFSDVFERAF